MCVCDGDSSDGQQTSHREQRGEMGHSWCWNTCEGPDVFLLETVFIWSYLPLDCIHSESTFASIYLWASSADSSPDRFQMLLHQKPEGSFHQSVENIPYCLGFIICIIDRWLVLFNAPTLKGLGLPAGAIFIFNRWTWVNWLPSYHGNPIPFSSAFREILICDR